MRIGIFGGTFNPPHIGHRRMAEISVRKLSLDILYVIPAARPPHKEITENSPSDGERFEMARLNFEGVENVLLSDTEFSREGPSYTVDTLRQIESENPGCEMFLIVGADMLLSFEQWFGYRDILSMCTLVAFPREEGQRKQFYMQAGKLSGYEKACGTEVLDDEIVSISSTELRELLRDRHGVEYVLDSVYELIIKHRFYGAKPNLDWLRPRAHAMLDARRVPHVLGCEEEAAKLAARWGSEVGDAREAAILHDITKNLCTNQQLILCEKYGIITDTVEMENGKLLHAKTGAEISRGMFGVSGDIYDAILWHTTGRPGMGLLEQIIYIADYIEPNRDFPGVEKLREKAYIDLRGALKLGLEMSINELTESGRTPHSRSVETLNWLINLGVM